MMTLVVYDEGYREHSLVKKMVEAGVSRVWCVA